jgi:hypothetical protein
MFLFMNFHFIEHPLAHCQLKHSKLFLPYQLLTASVIHSLKSFLANKSVPDVDKLTVSYSVLNVQLTGQSYCLQDHVFACTAARSSLRGAGLTWELIWVALISTKQYLRCSVRTVFHPSRTDYEHLKTLLQTQKSSKIPYFRFVLLSCFLTKSCTVSVMKCLICIYHIQ